MISLIFKTERKRISSDAFLILMLLMTPVVTLIVRTYWGDLDRSFPHWNIDQYKTVVAIFIALLTPMLMGLILGFNLIIERQQGMFSAIQITPAGLKKYLLVKSSGYIIVSFLLTILLHQLLGFSEVQLDRVILIALLAQSLMPLATMILLSFASNIVEAFAVMKATGGLITIPVILIMFAPGAWAWLSAPLPTWWTIWGYFELSGGNTIGYAWMAVGTLLQLIVCLPLWNRLLKSVN
jgi:fluoroquinolone transport system permease protein